MVVAMLAPARVRAAGGVGDAHRDRGEPGAGLGRAGHVSAFAMCDQEHLLHQVVYIVARDSEPM
jgi:hypothetical protein